MRSKRCVFLSLALALGFSQAPAAAGPAVDQLQALVDDPHQDITPPDWEEAWQDASRETFSSLFSGTADWLTESSIHSDGTVQIRIEIYSPDYWTNPVQSLFLSAQIDGDATAQTARHAAILEPVELGWFWVREEALNGQMVTVNNLAEEAIDSVAWQHAGAVFEVRHATDARDFAKKIMGALDSSGLSKVFGQTVPTAAVAPVIQEDTATPPTDTPPQTTIATPTPAADDEGLDTITLDASPTVVRIDERGPIHDAPLHGEPYPKSGDLVRLPGTDVQGWIEAVGLSTVAIRLPSDIDTSVAQLVVALQQPRSRIQFSLDEALLEAAASGSKSAVLTALANGAEISALNSGRSALHLAIENKDTALVETLLEQGSAPDQEGLYGTTPLKLAVQHGSVAAIETILRAGAQVDQVPVHASTRYSDRPSQPFPDAAALTTATVNRQDEVVAQLLAAGADPNLADRFGLTALHLARDRSIAKLLLDAGADPNAKADGIGRMAPLHAVAGQAHELSLSALLLSRGADPQARVTDLPGTDEFDNATPLLLAADGNDLNLVDLLLAIGADPDAKPASGASLWDLLPSEYDDYAAAAIDRPGQHWWLEAEFSARSQLHLFQELLDETPQIAAEILADYQQLGVWSHFRHPSLADFLRHPIQEGRRDLVAAALDLGLNPRTMGIGLFRDHSAFELSVTACDTDLIDLLLGYRVDPSRTTADGQVIFDLAAEHCGAALGDKLRSIGERQQQAREHFLQGYLAFEDGDYANARAVLGAPQAALQPKAKSLLAIMALDGLGAAPDPLQAIALLTQAASLNEPLALRLLGSMRQRGMAGNRDYAAAEATYRKLVAQSPTWGAMSLAMLWADPHNPDTGAAESRRSDALAIARDAYRSAPSRTGLLFGYGFIRAALEDPVGGLADMRTAVTLWGDQANAAHHLALGDAYQRVGLLLEARQSWQAALTRAVSPWEKDYLTGRLAEVQP